MDKDQVKLLLKNKNYYPYKKYGQNFLIDKNILLKIAKFAEGEKNIIEVGSGIGNLTLELAKRADNIIAIEKDERMIEVAKNVLFDIKNIKFIHEDILKILKNKNLNLFFKNHYKVIANLPYNIATLIIKGFLENKTPPQEMILMTQKEVAQRICATPPNMSILAVSVQFYAEAKILFKVSRNCFWPMPNVDSAVLKITPFSKSLQFHNINTNKFFKIVKAGFSRPRAQLLNNFSNELKLKKESVKKWLAKNNIDPKQRAETLSVEEWIQLTINNEKNNF